MAYYDTIKINSIAYIYAKIDNIIILNEDLTKQYGYKFIGKDKFNEYFISVKEYRENRLRKILN